VSIPQPDDPDAIATYWFNSTLKFKKNLVNKLIMRSRISHRRENVSSFDQWMRNNEELPSEPGRLPSAGQLRSVADVAYERVWIRRFRDDGGNRRLGRLRTVLRLTDGELIACLS